MFDFHEPFNFSFYSHIYIRMSWCSIVFLRSRSDQQRSSVSNILTVKWREQLFLKKKSLTHVPKSYYYSEFFVILLYLPFKFKWGSPIILTSFVLRGLFVSFPLKRLLLLQFSSDSYQTWFIWSLGQCVVEMCLDKKFDHRDPRGPSRDTFKRG